ncbi:hypothetical protein K491DRAFT_91188 [Lophiostoma macrostomum CBS 122681]|uniref:Uncharacterized protein n=1 Tax=Lophiostoma macrostomum CBS 122681 TaxID=1314788 RepID=A0A6A6TJD1_9PLEO|nr:hypothetical protein K491DRAFT_91188 [Lophiostoma macrostomum CBS 122681]
MDSVTIDNDGTAANGNGKLIREATTPTIHKVPEHGRVNGEAPENGGTPANGKISANGKAPASGSVSETAISSENRKRPVNYNAAQNGVTNNTAETNAHGPIEETPLYYACVVEPLRRRRIYWSEGHSRGRALKELLRTLELKVYGRLIVDQVKEGSKKKPGRKASCGDKTKYNVNSQGKVEQFQGWQSRQRSKSDKIGLPGLTTREWTNVGPPTHNSLEHDTRDISEDAPEEEAMVTEQQEEDGAQPEKDFLKAVEMIELGVADLLKKAAPDNAISDLRVEELTARLLMGLGERGVVITMDQLADDESTGKF